MLERMPRNFLMRSFSVHDLRERLKVRFAGSCLGELRIVAAEVSGWPTGLHGTGSERRGTDVWKGGEDA